MSDRSGVQAFGDLHALLLHRARDRSVGKQAVDCPLEPYRKVGFKHPALVAQELHQVPLWCARRHAGWSYREVLVKRHRHLGQQQVLPETFYEVALGIPGSVLLQEPDKSFEVIAFGLDDADKI